MRMDMNGKEIGNKRKPIPCLAFPLLTKSYILHLMSISQIQQSPSNLNSLSKIVIDKACSTVRRHIDSCRFNFRQIGTASIEIAVFVPCRFKAGFQSFKSTSSKTLLSEPRSRLIASLLYPWSKPGPKSNLIKSNLLSSKGPQSLLQVAKMQKNMKNFISDGWECILRIICPGTARCGCVLTGRHCFLPFSLLFLPFLSFSCYYFYHTITMRILYGAPVYRHDIITILYHNVLRSVTTNRTLYSLCARLV